MSTLSKFGNPLRTESSLLETLTPKITALAEAGICLAVGLIMTLSINLML